MASSTPATREPREVARARRNAVAVVNEFTGQSQGETTALLIASMFNGASKIAIAQSTAEAAQITANTAITNAATAQDTADEAILKSAIGL